MTTRGFVTHVGSGRETSVLDLVATILKLMDAEDHPVVHGADRPGDVRRHCADITKARERFGFEPKISIEDGLKATVAWYLATSA